jgi:hypothetical protein
MPSFDAGQTGITPGVTITRPDKTEYAARTTVGFTEVPAGSGSFDFAHPAPGTLLKFTFDALIDGVTYYASVWDDGLTTMPARAGDAMTLTAAYDAAKEAASQTSVNAIPTTPLLAADYTAPDNAGIAAAKAAAEAAQVAAAVGYIDGDTLITQASLDTDGAAIGRTTAGATVTAYLAADTGRATPKRQATADEDGDWSLYLTGGSTYTLVFAKSGYSEATAEVTVA